MSAVASLSLLGREDLVAVRRAAASGDARAVAHALASHHAGPDYPWSGYVLATLLPYLEEERGLDLMKSELDELAASLTSVLGASCFFLTTRHEQAVAELDAARFEERALREYYNAFNETNDEAVGRAMLDGVRFLRAALSHVGADAVVLLRIG